MRLFALFACSVLSLGAEVSFNRDIRPILSDTCFRCHGPDSSSRMAGLRLDLREEAIKPRRAGAPLEPGSPQRSQIIQRIEATGPKQMPPASAHKSLTPKQKELLTQWVAEGAKYEGHWAYQPLRPVPGSIDVFLDAEIARARLTKASAADRATLIRRLSLDLTGLPASPADLASQEPYEAIVERLLASPRYAEKQTMLWLDAVRYADTCGFHGDNAFPAWPYRDYVLQSFLHNKPFDVFTREQLAGDLLPNATREQRTATAFYRLTRTSAEGGIQPKEYLAKYAADRVRTVSSVWLGATLGCAECHDHKFDPYSAKDFYAMKAFFADIQETGLVPDRGKDSWGKQLLLPTPAQEKQMAELEKRLRKQPVPEATTFGWVVQTPKEFTATNGTELRLEKDSLLVAGGKNPDNSTYSVTIDAAAGPWTHLAIEVQADDGLPGANVARGADRLVLTGVEANVPFSLAATNTVFSTKDLPAMAVLDADTNSGWGVNTYGDPRTAVLSLRFAKPFTGGPLTVRLRHDSAYRRAASASRFRRKPSPGRRASARRSRRSPKR
jgi:hypothetical protein